MRAAGAAPVAAGGSGLRRRQADCHPATLTLVPSSKRYWPSTTTVSPAFNPLETKAQSSCICATVTGVNFAARLVPSPVDGEDVRAVGAALDDVFRNHQAVDFVHQDAGVDELAGPEAEIGVGKGGLAADGAGGGVNLVVNDGERSGVEHWFCCRDPGPEPGQAPWASLRETTPTSCSGRVKTTEMGRNWVMTTTPLVSVA